MFIFLVHPQLDPDNRPTFKEVVEILENIDGSGCRSDGLSNSYSEPSIASTFISPSPERENEAEESNETSVQHGLDAQLSSLLEGGVEANTTPRKELIVPASSYFLDHKNGESRIDSGSWLKTGSDLYQTPLQSEGLDSLYHTSSSTSSFGYNFHSRQTSDSSEISFHLPPPSFAWAPPPSPAQMHRMSQSYPSSPTSPRKTSVISLDGYFSSPEASPVLRKRRFSDSSLFQYPHNPPALGLSGRGTTRSSCCSSRYSRTSSDPLNSKPAFLVECAPQVEDESGAVDSITRKIDDSVGECGRPIPDPLCQNLDRVFGHHCSNEHHSASFSLSKVLESSPGIDSSSCSSCGSNRELDRLTHVCTSASNLQIC